MNNRSESWKGFELHLMICKLQRMEIQESSDLEGKNVVLIGKEKLIPTKQHCKLKLKVYFNSFPGMVLCAGPTGYVIFS